MRFSVGLELRGSKFELNFSRKNTASNSNPSRPVDYAHTSPVYTRTTFPDGSELRLHWSPTSLTSETKPQSVLNNKRPSRVRSFHKKIGKMLSFHVSRTHPFHNSQSGHPGSLYELPEDRPEMACSQGQVPELPGSQIPWELSAQSNDTPYDGNFIFANTPSQSFTQPVNLNDALGRHSHQQRPNSTAIRRRPLPPSQMLTQVNSLSQMSPSSSFMSSPQNISPTKDQVFHPYPLMTNATNQQAQHTSRITPSPTTSSSCSVSPMTPTYHKGLVDCSQYGAWTGPAGHSFSPVQECQPHEPKTGRSSHKFGSQGHSEVKTMLPTPPLASPRDKTIMFSLPEASDYKSDARQSPPVPQTFVQSDRLTSHTTGPANTTHFGLFNQTSQDIGSHPTSAWERFHAPFLQSQRSNDFDLFPSFEHEDDDDSIDNANETLPPYDEHPSTQPVTMHDGVFAFNLTPPEGAGVNNRKSKKACLKIFDPISCSQCGRSFKGPYQKGNLRRHIKYVHIEIGFHDEGNKCRECFREYNRADARRKHEWKKHKIMDCKPKRRVERMKERRESI